MRPKNRGHSKAEIHTGWARGMHERSETWSIRTPMHPGLENHTIHPDDFLVSPADETALTFVCGPVADPEF